MRALSAVLMGLGVTVGAALAFVLAAAHSLPWLTSVPWLVAVGLAKLTFLSALGLIGAGAVVRRLASRGEERGRLRDGLPTDDLDGR
jgi:hypothetical protein